MTVPRYRTEICRARNIFFLSRSTKRCNSIFFSLCHLQIVLLTIANTKIHIFFYRNNDFNGDLTCVRGMKALPRRATCVSSSLPYFFNGRLLEHLSWVHFLESMARVILSGCFRHAMEYINNNKRIHSIGPFSCVVTWSVKLVHGPLAS